MAAREQLMAGIDDLVRGIFGPSMRRRHKPADLALTIGQLECLRLIGEMGAPSMSELAAEMDLRPSTTTGLIDTLVHRGKVERIEDPKDRRIVRVQLSAQGRRERKAHLEHRRRHLLELLGDLSDDDLAKLHDALNVLHDAALRRRAGAASREQEGRA